MSELTIVALSVPGLPQAAIPLAAARAGAIGILDVSWSCDERAAIAAAKALGAHAGTRWGLKLRSGPLADRLLADVVQAIPYAVVEADDGDAAAALGERLAAMHAHVVVEVTNDAELAVARRMNPFAILLKGCESGGRIGDESSFILLQRLREPVVWVQGGIGVHSAGAAWCGGAAAVVLDAQLWLTQESPLGGAIRAALAKMDGAAGFVVAPEGAASSWRLFSPSRSAAHDVQRLAESRTLPAPWPPATTWRDVLGQLSDWSSERGVLPVGQDAAFAARFANECRTVGAVVALIRRSAADAVGRARRDRALQKDAPLARSHGTEYPIVQGPMTRVSDGARFAEQVAAAGALPFLALALMRDDTVDSLLEETRARLGGRPFGVGILGFVPLETREAQLRVIRAHRPPFALIAGGRPDQAEQLESEGIATYLHVPSPALLESFLEAGVRRFVFEGRECGGHVGPRCSFVLWDQMTTVLLNWLNRTRSTPTEIHVLFAGGIHDARSGAMVSTLAAPLVARGVNIGVLLGTAYLFTAEAVATGAIVPAFQEVALQCQRTTLFETAAGHSTRCALTPFADTFNEMRRRLTETGASAEERRDTLERLNLGRLRLAAKGVIRETSGGSPGPLRAVDTAEQRVDGLYMMGQVAALRDRTCTIAELHEEVSAGAVAWLTTREEPTPEEPLRPSRPSDVAIVGIGCMFPKANTLDRFWQNILAGVDAIEEVPATRWNWRDYFDADQTAPDRIYSRWGGFLDAALFDPVRYGMPPNSLPSIEPLQLLALEAARAALEDAGYATRDFPRERTAVVLGVSGGASDLGHAYIVRAAVPGLPAIGADLLARLPEWTEDSFAGVLPNLVAGRIANRFNLGGANYTVDAACASSLAAIHTAICELESGASDLVIAGAADTQQNPFTFLAFSKTHALSPRGRCRPFDASADGIAVSEGLAMIVLKRLRDAERDGDRIYAVIKGVGASSDGREKALTAPGRDGQVRALDRAYARAGVSPATVACVEAHGTGTVVGDQIELESLTHVYRAAGAEPDACAIGSVKSMIGHTKATAGLAGLIKTALALHHKVLPPTIGVETPNRRALPPGSPFYVNTSVRPWIANPAGGPRRAAVSAFGFGGTNFHAVLEEWGGGFAAPGAPHAEWPSELLVFAGDATADVVHTLRAVLDKAAASSPRLCDLAAALWQAARPAWSGASVRLAIVVRGADDLRPKLEAGIERLTAPTSAPVKDVFYVDQPLGPSATVAFVFPGQGSQYPDMFRDLAVYFHEAREAVERANRVLAGRFPRPLSAFIFPPPRFSDSEEENARAALTATHVAQPALGAVAMAAAGLLESFAVRPAMAAGHSYGEYAALCSAGVFSEEELYDLSELRGRLIAGLGNPTGTMAAVEASADAVSGIIAPLDSVWIANINAPAQTVIAGTVDAVERAVGLCSAAGLNARSIAVSCAFHSPMMAAAKDRLAERLHAVAASGPAFDVFSNSSGAPYPREAAALIAHLTQHLVAKVDFDREIRAMYDGGARIFVEAGPRNLLSRLVGRILGDRPHAAIPIDVEGQPGLLQLQRALAQLVAHHVPVTLDRLFEGRSDPAVELDGVLEAAQQRPRTPTAWHVDGGQAWPLADGGRPAGPFAPRERTIVPAASAESPATQEVAATARRDTAIASAPSRPQGNATRVTTGSVNGDRDSALRGFHDVMAKILDAQREIMLAYLKGGDAEAPSRTVQQLEVASPPVALPAPEAILAPDQPALPAADPPKASGAGRASVKDTLIAIVSKRTGYPADMLTVDANIESDLGIDSLKITEILAAFQQACDGDEAARVRGAMEKVIRAKTLGTMIDTLQHALDTGGGSAPPQAATTPSRSLAAADPSPDAPIDVPRFTFSAVPVPIDGRTAPAGTFIVTDDEGGIAAAVAELLAGYGCEVVIVRDGEPDLTDPNGVARLFEIAKHRSGHIGGVVHLLPLKDRCAVALHDGWPGEARRQSTAAFLLAREAAAELTRRGEHTGAAFVAAVPAPAHGGDLTAVTAAGLGGIVRTAAAEWPDVRCRLIEVGAAETPTGIAAGVVDEICALDDVVTVQHVGSRRLAVRATGASRLGRTRSPLRLSGDSVVLLTGGYRGITAAIARDLAVRYRPTLHLVARSQPPDGAEAALTANCRTLDEIRSALLRSSRQDGRTPAAINAECARLLHQREWRRTIREVEAAGASVHYHRADVRDDAAFAGIIAEIHRRHGRIDGVIHGAGIIEDALLENKALDSFERVFDTKVTGAAVLSRALDPRSLQFLVLFSSVAACFGSRGQVDYAAANQILNALASHLDQEWPGRVLSLAWGPWADVGMVSPEVAAVMKQKRMPLIAVDDGVRAFHWELLHAEKGSGPIVLGDGPWRDAVPRHVDERLEPLSVAASAGEEPRHAAVVR